MNAERAPLLAADDDDDQIHERPASPLPNRCSSLEKVLLATSVTLFVLLAAFVGLYARRVYDSPRGDQPSQPPNDYPHCNKSEPICLTPDCIQAAAHILKDIDTTVDPCEDFYAYSCNGWENNHDIPDDKAAVSTFVSLSVDNKATLRRILSGSFDDFYNRIHGHEDRLPKPDKLIDRQNFNLLQTFYKTCMNESAVDAAGAEPIIPLLRKIRELYSADASSTKGQNQQLARAMSYLIENGASAFLDTSVEADAIDPKQITVTLYQSGLSLPSKEYYESDSMINTLVEAITDTLNIIFEHSGGEFGWNQWNANKVANMIVDVEKRLAGIHVPFEQLRDPILSYNPKTLSELGALSPEIDWDILISHLVPSGVAHPNTVVVSSVEFLEKLSTIVLKESNARSVQAYLYWQIVVSYIDGLSDRVHLPLRKLEAKVLGTNPKNVESRWEQCLKQVDEYGLGFMAGRYFVLDKFPEAAKKMGDSMVEAIKNVFVQRLPSLDWLDDSTRERAVKKVDKLIRKIGYPTVYPDVMSPVDLSSYYSDLSIHEGDYFSNFVASRKWSITKEWQKVGKPPNLNEWGMNPQEVNAYYNPSFNEIVFPAGILQDPFFNSKYPDYLNFGGIGVVIGHELTHGFDNSGRQFDADGRMVEWWSEGTSKAFDSKATCFVQQYSNFTVPDPDGKEDLHVNGNLTLGENMADNGGLGEAYLAWKARADSGQYNNALLPGLDDLSPDKLFFINFGRVWCEKSRPEKLKQRVLTNEHSPARWRVNGAVQNSQHFSTIFQCPSGSPMNPTDKCEVW